MNGDTAPAVGIDLGTTYSAVAYIDDTGRPVTLVNAEGDLVTPSVVLFEGQLPVVGKEALKALATEAEHVAQCAKRELGERAFHKPLQGALYPPEALEALVLNKLRADAARQIGDFRKVVITVPAYFDEVRRKATQDAGYMAGFEVLDIINEPTAAAIAHGFLKGFLNRKGESNAPRRLLVYDLGGGTFDVTVMEIRGNEYLALATDGDVQLGGQDWDMRLVDFVAEEFKRAHDLDPREDPNTAGRLWRECEDAKRTLSARGKASVSCDYKGQAVRVEITREKFEELTQDLLNRTEFTTKQTLQAAGLTWKDLDQVLLVGGSTRMPMVANMLRKLSGKEPDASVSVDEAVAHGAALHAGILLAEGRGQRPLLQIKNVNSHSLGVVAVDARTGRKRNAILIPRNTPLPVTAKRVFRTQKVDQKSILVQIVEGESASPEDCSQVGKCVARDLPPDLAAQTPIEVRFAYEENGRLTIHVNVAGARRELKHEITRDNTMSQQQLDAWRLFVTGHAGREQVPSGDSQVAGLSHVGDSQIAQLSSSGGELRIGPGDSQITGDENDLEII
jgi:molecular chaperone DnaK